MGKPKPADQDAWRPGDDAFTSCPMVEDVNETVIDIRLPTDCGNAPRIGIVGDVAVNWATGGVDRVSEWLADNAAWTRVGADTHIGPKPAEVIRPPFSPQRVEIISIITHGRLASCDGYLEADGRRIDFSHVFRFATTSKNAKIVEVRTYCIEA